MKNIILIGYRCTGKTSVGKKLSERLDLPFIDTDGLIMLDAGMSVDEIVREGGWTLFRQKEREVIGGLSSVENVIIAPGGGALEDPENREVLRGNGLFVWLTADSKTVVERMRSDRKSGGQRPPLSRGDPGTEAAVMIRKREPVYRELADLAIDTSNKSIDAVADEIFDFVHKEQTCQETPSERSSG